MAQRAREAARKARDLTRRKSAPVSYTHLGKEEIRLIYEPSTKNMSLEQALEMNRQRDIRMKSTSVGPHRDDVCFMVGNLDIRRFGSDVYKRQI